MKNEDIRQISWAFTGIFASIGIALSTYLLKLHIEVHSGYESFCDISDKLSCSTVALSKYSTFLGIPNGTWGIIVYSIILLAALVFINSKKLQDSFKHLWLAFLAGCVIYSLYLTGIEAFVLKTFCIFCLGQQLMLIIIALLQYPIFKKS